MQGQGVCSELQGTKSLGAITKDLGASYSKGLLSIVLAAWGLAILSGFVVIVLRFRQIWLYPEMSDSSWMKRWKLDVIEFGLLYLMLPLHPLFHILGIISTGMLIYGGVLNGR